MANTRFGWHSGMMHCADAKIMGDLYIQDDIVFSDVSAGSLGVTGGIDMDATTSAVGIAMGGTFSTAAIDIDSATITGRAIRIGVKGTPLKISTGATVDAEPANNYLFGLFSVVNASEAASTDELRSAWVRTRVNTNIHIGSSANWGYGVTGMESQVKFYGGSSGTDIYSWQASGLWAQLETDGVATVSFKDGCVAAAVYANVGLTAAAAGGTTIDSGAVACGVAINSNTATNVTATGGFYGLYVYHDNTALKDFTAGIYLESAFTTGIEVLACTTGLSISGATTTAISVSGSATTGVSLLTGTFGTGLSIAGTATTGIAISSASLTDGILISGTTPVDGLHISSACSGNGINLSGAMAIGLHVTAATDNSIFLEQAVGANQNVLCIEADPTIATAGARGGYLYIGSWRDTAWTANDGNPDTGLKISLENNTNSGNVNGGLRAIDATVSNDDASSSCGYLNTVYFNAKNTDDVSTSTAVMETLKVDMTNQGICTTTQYGIRVLENSEGTIPADTVGIKVTTSANAPAAGTRADAMLITTGGASGGWTDGLHVAGTITNAINIAGTHTVGMAIANTVTTGISYAGGAAGVGISVGAFAGSYATGSAVLLNASNTKVAEFYGESTANFGSSVMTRAVRGRHLIAPGADTEILHETYGVQGQMCVKNGSMRHYHAGLLGTFESSGTCHIMADANGSAGVIGRIGTSSTTVIEAGGILAGMMAVSFADTALDHSGSGAIYAAYSLRTKVSSHVFEWAFWMPDNHATAGIHIGSTAGNGIEVINTALTAGDTYSGIRSTVTAAAANNTYGTAGYFDTSLTGTQGGHVYGLGSWMNINSGTIGLGKYLCAQDNGIYYAGGTITGAKMIIGMRMEAPVDLPTQVGGTGRVCPFSINMANKSINAVFDCNGSSDLGVIGGAGTDTTELLPILMDNSGNIRYVRLYS